MSAPLSQQCLNALLASLDYDQERARQRYERLRQQLISAIELKGLESPEDLVDEAINRAARELANGRVLKCKLSTYLITDIYYRKTFQEEAWYKAMEARERPPATLPDQEPNPVSSAPVATQSIHRQKPPLEHLRHLLQTRFPVLYAQVLEPTLADLREEHSAALAERRPFKARIVLLQGCGALVAAALCQLGYSLLGRIAALWKARSPK